MVMYFYEALPGRYKEGWRVVYHHGGSESGDIEAVDYASHLFRAVETVH